MGAARRDVAGLAPQSGHLAGKIRADSGRLARTGADVGPVRAVNILAGGEAVRREAESLVGGLPNVTLYDIATNDVWARDHGPMFLAGPPGLPLAVVDWEYNAWGGKYPPFDLDNDVPRQVAELTGRRRFVPGIILEGGAIDGDGAGTILTTEECLLNPNRNPQLDRGQVEQYLADYCAARKVVWLGGGIAGDDTDGHIDELARFVGPRTVVCAIEPDSRDENYEPLADNFERLASATDAEGIRVRGRADQSTPPAVSRRPAIAGQLHELLHCQRRRLGAGFRRRCRPGGLRHLGRIVSRPNNPPLAGGRSGLGTGGLSLHHAAAAGNGRRAGLMNPRGFATVKLLARGSCRGLTASQARLPASTRGDKLLLSVSVLTCRSENRRGLSPFCAVRGAKWDCLTLPAVFG